MDESAARACGLAGIAVTLATVVLCAVPPVAMAHRNGRDGADTRSEKALLARETQILGAAHAAEHAQARVSERVMPRERVMARANGTGSVATTRLAPAVVGPPAEVGAWNRQRGGPFAMPAVAIHSVLLPTGKVMLWGRPPGDPGAVTAGYGWLWDPVTGASKRIDPPNIVHPDGQLKPANIWCAGQSLLADGTVLVTGGNLADQTTGNDWKGLATAFTFNPFTETWAVQPRMRHGRWYPSQLLMGDGRTLIMSGLDESGVEQMNKDVEMFTPGATSAAAGTMSLIGSQGGAGQPPTGEYYPHLFWMPSGRALVAGQHVADSWFLTPPSGSGSFSWTDAPNLSRGRFYGNAVLQPGGPAGSTRVLELGGADLPATAAADSETFDEQTSAWTPAPAQNIGRGHANTVLLPGGSMVTVGGGLGIGPTGIYDATTDQKQVELYNPAKGAWRLGAAQQQRRAYHSTALLLADGRVLSAGDDAPEAGVANSGRYIDDAEIYEPPYLFNGDGSLASRPQASLAPASVRWGTRFAVRSPSTDITRAVLVAPGATTHANDMQQRHVELAVAQNYSGTGVNVVSPPNANVAPPGYYMLFLLNSRGVPSIARFIRLDPAAPAPEVLPPTDRTPPNVSITAPAQNATVTGTLDVVAGASDAVGVASVQFKIDGQNLGAADTSAPYRASWNTATASAGGHTVTAVARDAAGNSATSSPIAVKVPPAGLVAAYGFEETSGPTVADSSGKGNAGTISGALRTTAGRHGRALSFDGIDDWVTVPGSSSLALTSAMTLEAWVKTSNANQWWQTILTKEKPPYMSYQLYATGTYKPLANAWRDTNGNYDDDDGLYAPASRPTPTGTWTHLAATYDSATLRIYMNGTQIASTQTSGAITNSSAPLRIGGNAIWGEYFFGIIDEVRVYNRALSAAQLTADMARPAP